MDANSAVLLALAQRRSNNPPPQKKVISSNSAGTLAPATSRIHNSPPLRLTLSQITTRQQRSEWRKVGAHTPPPTQLLAPWHYRSRWRKEGDVTPLLNPLHPAVTPCSTRNACGLQLTPDHLPPPLPPPPPPIHLYSPSNDFNRLALCYTRYAIFHGAAPFRFTGEAHRQREPKNSKTKKEKKRRKEEKKNTRKKRLLPCVYITYNTRYFTVHVHGKQSSAKLRCLALFEEVQPCHY